MKLIRPQDLSSPRFWLFLWGGLGALFIVYVIIAAAVQSAGRAAGKIGPHQPAILNDQSLLTGEMADFVYAFTPRNAPPTPFGSPDGATTLSDFDGKVTLVNLWATWCAPCLKELPSLDALQERLGGDQFQVVAIAADAKGPDLAQAYLDRLDVANLTLYTDPRLEFVSAIGGTPALPISILYDAAGNEIGRLVGEANWASVEAQTLVRRAIEG